MVKHWCGVVVGELVVTETEWRIYASMNWAITASDNGLSPDWRQTIIGINAGILLIRPSGTNFSEILIEIHFHSRKCIWKCRMENSGLSVLTNWKRKLSTTPDIIFRTFPEMWCDNTREIGHDSFHMWKQCLQLKVKIFLRVWHLLPNISRNVILPERSGIFHFTFPAYVKVKPFKFPWVSSWRHGIPILTGKMDRSCNLRNKLTTTNNEHRCYDALRRPWPIMGIKEMQL